MANRKGKVKPVINDSLVMRTMSVINIPERAVIATENPVPRLDERTLQVVNEVLLMDGIVWRGGRNQIPIVDSHDISTVQNVLGSIQHCMTDGAELYGKPVFASDPAAQTIAQRVAEGHITDFSITANPIESLFVKRGDTYTTSRGMTVDGPAIIHVKWEPHNASICATGADVYSTIRRSYTDLHRAKVTRMDEALLGQLSAMGMPEGMTDPNQILAWVAGKLSLAAESEDPSMDSLVESSVSADQLPTEETKPVENSMDEKPQPEAQLQRSADVHEQIKRAVDAEIKRRKEIQAAVKIAKLDRSFADELCDTNVSIADANRRIIERMATTELGTSVGTDVRVTRSADDKFFESARDGLLMRANRSSGIKRSLVGSEPAEGAKDFSRLSMTRIAQEMLRRSGAPVERMSNREIAMAAIGHRPTLERYRIERAEAYHTTGSFSNLLLDAANKTLLAGYEEAPYTWNLWARQANSVEDFKAINRIRFSESPDLEIVPEQKKYPEKAMSDSKESYRVEKYGAMFSVSWETVVNDDLDAISRIPAMHGNAARRVQNKKVYEVLTSNPSMSDGVTLFNSSHSNQSASAAAPSVTTLNAAFLAMMTQTGLTAGVILNIQPRYLIVPAALAATVLELLGSTSYIVANGNSGVQNIYGPNGDRPLQAVIEPQLDASSASVWYMAADASQIDTVEIAFLSGEESPTLETEWDMKTDTYLYKIRQTFGVKAIDWRGLYRNS